MHGATWGPPQSMLECCLAKWCVGAVWKSQQLWVYKCLILSCPENTVYRHPSTTSDFESLCILFSKLSLTLGGRTHDTYVPFATDHFMVIYYLHFEQLLSFISCIETAKEAFLTKSGSYTSQCGENRITNLNVRR